MPNLKTASGLFGLRWNRLGADLLVVGLLLGGGRAFSKPVAWPKDYTVAEETQSPDGRYGILIPPADDENGVDYFADLKTHRVLGEVPYNLKVNWCADSSYGVAQHEISLGFEELLLFEPQGDGFRQVDLGARIVQELNRVTDRQSPGVDVNGEVEAQELCRPGELVVRAYSNDNQRERPGSTDCAVFPGTYSVTAHGWTMVKAMPVPPDKEGEIWGWGAIWSWGDINGALALATNYAQKDALLNEVYAAVRFVQPPAAFAKIKADQIAWLKQRDTAKFTDDQKASFVAARIRQLAAFMW